VFDASAKKKKKPKKPFDFEAVLQSESAETKPGESGDPQSEIPQSTDDVDLDLESFGKKKKKKKVVIAEDAAEDEEDMSMEFADKKKKKKKKKDLDELVADLADKENEDENAEGTTQIANLAF